MLTQELVIGDDLISRIEYLEMKIDVLSTVDSTMIKAGEISVRRLYDNSDPDSNWVFLKLASGSDQDGVPDHFEGELRTLNAKKEVIETLSFEKAYIQAFSSNDGMEEFKLYTTERDQNKRAAVVTEELWQSAVIRFSGISQEQSANTTEPLDVAGFGK